jgi:hypothetical protein
MKIGGREKVSVGAKRRQPEGRSVLLVALLLSGCVGDDFGAARSGAGAGLNSEQRWQLREASRGGEHELVATLARMAWDNPQQKSSLAGYAADLRPESAEAIEVAVGR